MRILTTVLMVTASILFVATTHADAQIKINKKQMSGVVAASNTTFKKCLSQSSNYQSGELVLSSDDLSSAKGASDTAENALSMRLNGAPSRLGNSSKNSLNQFNPLNSLLGGDSSSSAPPQPTTGRLVFSLGNGYSKNAQPWLQPFNQGDPARAAMLMAHEKPSSLMRKRKYKSDPNKLTDEKLAKSVGVLGLVERATVSLAANDLECSVNFLDRGLRRSERQQGSFWGSDIEPYEHIMALNLKAIGYLLAGDDRARNMAQSSREKQGRAREQYAAEIEAYKEKAEADSQSKGLPNQIALMQVFNNAFNNSALKGNSQLASRMATPYVNPLADYLSAVIAETEASAGTGTSDEWSRATIAWKNASRLAPKTKFLKTASGQTDAWQRGQAAKGMKIVNVLVATGAAPTVAVSKIYLDVDGSGFPVMLPVRVPHSNAISGGRMFVGKKTAKLEAVSDVEGMVMRQAEDKRGGDMISALLRGWLAAQAGQAVGAGSDSALGNILGGAIRDSLAEPPTKSWSSLPQAYYAARLVVPLSETSVQISVPGSGTKSFPLINDQATFIYVVAKQNSLTGTAQDTVFAGGRLDFEVQ